MVHQTVVLIPFHLRKVVFKGHALLNMTNYVLRSFEKFMCISDILKWGDGLRVMVKCIFNFSFNKSGV